MCQSGIDVDIFLEDPGNCGAVNIVADGTAVAGKNNYLHEVKKNFPKPQQKMFW